MLAKLIEAALRGERIARPVAPKRKRDTETIELLVRLSDAEAQALTEHFEIERQEARGSWHLPEGEPISLGQIQLAHWMAAEPRLVLNVVSAERSKPVMRGAPATVALWVLEPLFEELFLPFKLRGGSWLGRRTSEQQYKSWAIADPLYEALGMSGPELDPFRPGAGWLRLAEDEIIQLRRDLVERWRDAAEEAPDRYRTFRIGQLVDRYYAKAKNGQALRRQVVSKPLGRTLTAYFGGDWLAFLDFIGEQPHGSEEIVQALPESKFVVGGSARAATLATEHGIAPEEVEKMLAAFWGQSEHISPIERRTDVFQRYWTEFDRLHAEQSSGMRSLWGLVEENPYPHPRLGDGERGAEDDGVHNERLYEDVLPAELNAAIQDLWGSVVLARYPERLVTEPAPHARCAKAFGPALSFWHGVGLTAWFLCEGPYSRTDIDGLPNYYNGEMVALADAGCPVPAELFRDLRTAERRHGAPEAAEGLVIRVSLFGDDDEDSRERSGVRFEQLREIVTEHRRAWAARYLDAYLRTRWEQDLRAIADAYHRQAAAKGKPPTLKQFAKLAGDTANLWFSGDLSALYRAIGLKAPDPPSRAERLVPHDPNAFATALYEELSGEPYTPPPTWKEDAAQRERHNAYTHLASMCVAYLQVEEAVGERPPLAALGRANFAYRSGVLSEDADAAWEIYGDAVHAVLARGVGCDPPVAERSHAEPGGPSAAPASPNSDQPPPLMERALERFRRR